MTLNTTLSLLMVILRLNRTPLHTRVAGGNDRCRPRRASLVTASAATRLVGEAERFLLVLVFTSPLLLDGAEAAFLLRARRGFGPAPGLRVIVGGVRPVPFPQTAFCGGGRGSEERERGREGAEAPAALGYRKAPREWRGLVGSREMITRNSTPSTLRRTTGHRRASR